MDRLKAFWTKLKQQWLDIWDKDKGIFILAAALIIFLKYRDMLISILVGSANRIDKNAQKQDSKLADQETQLKQQADAEVKKAQQEPQTEKPVDDDWYSKK